MATEPIAMGQRVLIESPLVFPDAQGDARGSGVGEGGTACPAFRSLVVSRVLASATCIKLLRPPAEYPKLDSTVAGVSDAEYSRAWAAAASNGFEHLSAEGDTHFLLCDRLAHGHTYAHTHQMIVVRPSHARHPRR